MDARTKRMTAVLISLVFLLFFSVSLIAAKEQTAIVQMGDNITLEIVTSMEYIPAEGEPGAVAFRNSAVAPMPGGEWRASTSISGRSIAGITVFTLNSTGYFRLADGQWEPLSRTANYTGGLGWYFQTRAHWTHLESIPL